MNRSKEGRISKQTLIAEGLAEKEQTEIETEGEEFVSAPLLKISEAEAAKYLGIGREELYRLIEWGEVNAIKAGDSLRVDMSSLEAFKTNGGTMSL
jgi:excisionase family DNA binding protein